jgi:hypothetical protein
MASSSNAPDHNDAARNALMNLFAHPGSANTVADTSSYLKVGALAKVTPNVLNQVQNRLRQEGEAKPEGFTIENRIQSFTMADEMSRAMMKIVVRSDDKDVSVSSTPIDEMKTNILSQRLNCLCLLKV